MELERPVVTISDPNNPGAYGDVLVSGDEKDPWRPSHAQKLVALTVACVVSLVWGVVSAVDMVRTDQRLDRAALQELQLAAEEPPYTDAPDAPGGMLSVALRSYGDSPVQLLRAELVGDGFDPLTFDDLSLEQYANQLIGFTDFRPCSLELVTNPVERIRVTVRTERGQVVTRETPLSPAAFEQVNAPARERCGYLPADEAFQTELEGTRPLPDGLRAELVVWNDSVLPLKLVRLREAPGLSLAVSPQQPPLDLAPQPMPGSRANVTRLVLTVRVTDCDVFLPALFNGGMNLGEPSLVRGWVERDGVVEEVPVRLSTAEQQEPFDSYYDSYYDDPAAEMMFRACPEFFSD